MRILKFGRQISFIVEEMYTFRAWLRGPLAGVVWNADTSSRKNMFLQNVGTCQLSWICGQSPVSQPGYPGSIQVYVGFGVDEVSLGFLRQFLPVQLHDMRISSCNPCYLVVMLTAKPNNTRQTSRTRIVLVCSIGVRLRTILHSIQSAAVWSSGIRVSSKDKNSLHVQIKGD